MHFIHLIYPHQSNHWPLTVSRIPRPTVMHNDEIKKEKKKENGQGRKKLTVWGLASPEMAGAEAGGDGGSSPVDVGVEGEGREGKCRAEGEGKWTLHGLSPPEMARRE